MPSSRATALTALAAATLTLSFSPSLALGADTVGKVTKLSNETTLSRWANPNARAAVRADHDSHARTVARLRLNTEDGYPEVYLVLNGYTSDSGDTWYQIRLPQRPNGKTGWVREEDIGPLQTVTTQLIVDRKRLRATLYRKGRKVFQAPVGVGKKSTPTPGGKFWIREKLVLSGGHGVYGPLAFGTAAYSDKLTDWPKGGVVGIHGTNQPSLVPGLPSHGCIRMHNSDILRLGRIMPIGTPLLIK